jgi:peptidoglycan-associated lipoprotein
LLAVVSAVFLLTACEGGADGSGGAGGAGGAGAGAGAPGSQEDLAANVGDRVFFDYNSATLSSEAQKTLDRQAGWLKQYEGVNITVEGHCDERGTREYNLALGERRAAAAKKYLVSLGVKSSRISTISYGKERPAVVGSNESAWAQNRRSVTVVGGQ